MSTKRRPIARRQKLRISQEAIDAYLAEDMRRLHRALGLKPWEANPLEDSVLGPCPYGPEYCIAQTWETVRELRLLLEDAVQLSTSPEKTLK